MTRTRTLSAMMLLLSVCGCKVGPNYQRPTVDVPGQYRGLAPNLPAQQTNQSFAEMPWKAVFQDKVLQDLIDESLKNNYDMRIAAVHILEAQANLGITRAAQLPTLSGAFSVENIRQLPSVPESTVDTGGLSFSYLVDFWGQFRRATESARASLLATKYARDLVQVTLISSVASTYYQLLGMDAEMAFSKQSVESDQEALRINEINFKGGEYAITDVYQAQLLVQQAEAEVISLDQSIQQTENALSILLGRNPGPILRGVALTEQAHMPEVPAGLPSAILERRPDVRQAEESLAAANANIGVAKAAFFPQIPLTATFGASSTALSSFLQGPATFWTVSGELAQPLYEGGALTNRYRLAKAQRDEAELDYRQIVQQAFEDVANGLVGYAQAQKFRQKIAEQTTTYRDTSRLASVRFKGGATSFLEVLTTQQQYFTSELSLQQAWAAELQGYVTLYQALGGGWQ
jgi:outer membrane protein, multidrug efflux system